MNRITRSVCPPSNPRTAVSANGLARWVRIWRGLGKWIFDSYRPELHYMRGPGPRWREKHAHVTSVWSLSRQR